MFRWPHIFTRNASEDIESQIDEVPVDSVAVAIPTQATTSSNNILNSNLSGSFRDDSDDELLTSERNIYEPINVSTTTEQNQSMVPLSSSSSPSTSCTNNTTQQSQQRLGVAAIPNTQFCPTTPLSSRSNRRGHNGGSDDYVV